MKMADFTLHLMRFRAQDSVDFSKYEDLSIALQEAYNTGSFFVKIEPDEIINGQTPGSDWNWHLPIKLKWTGRSLTLSDDGMQTICELQDSSTRGFLHPRDEVYDAFEKTGWMEKIANLTPEAGKKYAAQITTTKGNPEIIVGTVSWGSRMSERVWNPDVF